MDVVYFSSISENTHRFVEKLELPAERVHRLPLRRTDDAVKIDKDYVLVTPTYGAGTERTTVPHQVIRFLNDPENRRHIKGVIAAGNTNFGQHFCWAGKLVSEKCGVPLLHTFEVLGTPEDVIEVRDLLKDDNE